MTMTVKLSPTLEHDPRRRSAALGRPASELIREAVQAWLEATPVPARSAYDSGHDLFGPYEGPTDLADIDIDVYRDGAGPALVNVLHSP